jgi:addiction module HigA family antidote
MAITVSSAFAVHPGDWLRTEIVEPHGLSVTDAARHLGVTRQAMSALLNSRAGLSADMAIRFEKAFEVKADTMLRMQATYELA